jgi:predicted AlkP superfamily pyrophosphatase or phosphodiesterase
LLTLVTVPAARVACGSDKQPSPDRPVKAVERALVISIDGLRPDLLLRAKAPNLRRLMENGSFTFWAQTVPAAVTLPSHASMLTGVTPERHGVNFNTDVAPDQRIDPKSPTLFEVAKAHGLSTAMVAGKSKFDALAKVGTVDRSWVRAAKDEEVAAAAVATLREQKPQVMFVHFPGADVAGHGHGWGSPQQVAAVEGIDAALGKILDALNKSRLGKSTFIIVSADHGGAGLTHGADDVRSRTIPWIAVGPGVRKNYDLTRDPTLHVRTEDTFATACHMLGLAAPEGIDGKPVEQILEERQLLRDKP